MRITIGVAADVAMQKNSDFAGGLFSDRMGVTIRKSRGLH
jgi:hypothetical protein